MRCAFVVGLVLIGLAAVVDAKPKVAVVKLDGDTDGKVSAVVAEAAGEHAKVIGPKPTGEAIESLGISDPSTKKSLKKLRTKLEVDAIVYGKVEREGSKKRLSLTISGRGKKPASFELTFKSTTSKTFKKELRDELAKQIAPNSEGDTEEADEDEPRKKPPDDEPKPKPADEDRPRDKPRDEPKHASDDHRPKKRTADNDSTRVRKRSDRDDADEDRPRKKRRHHDDDEPERHVVTQSALWLDGGLAALRRTLTYKATGSAVPPPVGTGGISGRLEAEVYPGAFSTLKGAGAGFGIAGSLAKTVGLSIAVPGTTQSAGINEAEYSIGARYRFVFGTSSLALGLSYWSRHDLADRSALSSPMQLDMPDVSYTAIAPGAVARFAAAPKVGVLLALDVPLLLSTGPIGTSASFGRASAIAFVLQGGLDVALDPHYGLRFAALFEQIGLGFTASPPVRGVSSATDRTMGLAATFALIY